MRCRAVFVLILSAAAAVSDPNLRAQTGEAMKPADSLLERAEVTGVVLDSKGDPVGATIAHRWIIEAEEWSCNGVSSDSNGNFSINLETNGGQALIAYDFKRQQGAIAIVSRTNAVKPLTIRLAPLVALHGEYVCHEVSGPLGWCVTHISCYGLGQMVLENRSVNGHFELLVPPGKYDFNGYEGSGRLTRPVHRTIAVDGSETAIDLGHVDLDPTPWARSRGKSAPPWHITEARGLSSNATIADFHGKWLLLDFWGYWCLPCIKEMPALSQFYEQHAVDRANFEIVAIHNGASSLKEMDERLAKTVREYWNGHPLPFPVIIDATDITFTNFAIQGYPSQVLIDPDGNIVPYGNESTLASLLATRQQPIFPVAESPNGKWITRFLEGGRIGLNSTIGEEPISLNMAQSLANCVTFSANGKTIASGARDGTVSIYDLINGKRVEQIAAHIGPVFALDFSPDGKCLASAGLDQTRLWRVDTATEIPTLGGGRFPGWSLAFSPDGRRLAIGGMGGVVIKDVETGRELMICRKPSADPLLSLAFSPDGSIIATGDNRGAAVFSAYSGALMRHLGPPASGDARIFFGPTGAPVVDVLFAEDGRTVTTLTKGKTVRSWSVTSGKLCDLKSGPQCQLAQRLAKGLPDDAESLIMDAWTTSLDPQWSSDDHKLAVLQASRAIELSPLNAMAHQAAAAALYRIGRFRDAIKELDKYNEIGSSEPPSVAHLPMAEMLRALALERLGAREEARLPILRGWSLLWEHHRLESKLFEELNCLLFGTNELAARLFVLGELRNGVTPAELLAGLNRHSELTAEEQSAVRQMLPLANACCLIQQATTSTDQMMNFARTLDKSNQVAAEWRPATLKLAQQFLQKPR